jgi:ATP-binding cassette subfamily B multidrug efflux pump
MFANPRQLMGGETLKPKKTSETLRRFLRYVKPWWPMMVVAIVCVFTATWAQVTNPELIGQLVDCYLIAPTSGIGLSNFTQVGQVANASQANCWLTAGTAPQGITQTIIKSAFTAGGFAAPPANPAQLTQAAQIAGLGRMIVLIIILFLMGSAFTGLTFYSMNWVGQHILRTLRTEVFEHLHNLQLSYYADHESGDLMSRITNETDTIQQVVSFALVSVASGILLLVWIAFNMLSQNVPFALLSMAVTPLMLIATVWFSGQARKAFRRTRTEIGNVNAELQEGISSVREVQAFNRADQNIEQFKVTNAANRDANVRAVTFTSALAPTLEALGYVALAIVSVVGGLALLRNQALFGTAVSIGLVITFIIYVQRFNQPIQQIAILWANIQSAVAGAERIFGLLDVPLEMQDLPNAIVLPQLTGKVEFRNVSAAYKEDQPVLCDINFTAEPGQTIAIVGPTGAGKTTMINLIPRFYDVTYGQVLVDDIDVRQVTAQSLREQIAIVLQDTFMFSNSVMENIRFGRPDATDEEVIEAAKLSRADNFIDRLPDKYQTVLGERRSGLSQGQRQLLAIARAALSDPRILILDEATSSVDTRTERLIQKALENLLKGRTSFVIAHRLSTIRNADMLLVVDQGEIVERGRHEELLARRGFYYNLYMSQFRKEAPEEIVRLFDENGHKKVADPTQA